MVCGSLCRINQREGESEMGNGYPYATETRGSVHASVIDGPTLKADGECARSWCPNEALEGERFCWFHGS